MSKFAEYQKKDRDVFLEEEKTKVLKKEDQPGGDFDYTAEELKQHILERQNEGDIKARTKYYFEEDELMTAKATRYRNLATREVDLIDYSSKYNNHSASKRRKSARRAADSFDKAARLQKRYEEDKSDSVNQLKHKEEIIRARLEGMLNAAEVKSRSKENESYRKLKAKVSCLTILKEQADSLYQNERKADLKQKLGKEIERIDKELQKAQGDATKLIPPVVKQWEKAIGIPDKVAANCKIYKRKNPEMDMESAEILMRMKAISKETTQPGCMKALSNLETNGMYQGVQPKSLDLTRFLQVGFIPVLRDKNGLPLNAAEQKKADHNQGWIDALSEGNVEKKNKILLETFKNFERIHIPSAREIREKGIIYFLKNNPSDFYMIEAMSLSYDNLKKYDPFAQQYLQEHPEFQKKVTLAAIFSGCAKSIFEHDHLIVQEASSSTGDGSSYGVSLNNKATLKKNINKEYLDAQLDMYDAQYKDAYDGGPMRLDACNQMDDQQQDASKAFLSRYPDTFDKEMRKKIDEPASNELGKKLLELKSESDLAVLSGEAYDKAVGKAKLSKSQKLKRAESTIIKKELQANLRKNLEDYLVDRQVNMGKALQTDFYSKIERKHKIVRESDDKIFEHKMESEYLQYAFDWSYNEYTSRTTIVNRVKEINVNDIIPEDIKDCGNVLMSLDLSDFEYSSDEEFVGKLKETYKWLQRAESLEKAYRFAISSGHMQSGKKFSMSKMEGRLLALKEIKADYDARIAMMNSNYYALLADSDLKSLTDKELEKKQEDLQATDKELSEFIKNYRALNKEGSGFKKGASVKGREEAFSHATKKTAADGYEKKLKEIQALGLERKQGETDKEYQKRMLEVLNAEVLKHVETNVDSAYVQSNVPFSMNPIGGLTPEYMPQLDKWIDGLLANEGMLISKGFNETELAKIKKLRQESFEARKALDIQGYISMNMRFVWDQDYLENPADNEMIKKSTYNTLYDVYSTFQKIDSKIGVPPKHKTGAEPWYIVTIKGITEMFTDHGIYYNKDVEQNIEKKKKKQIVKFKKEIEEGKKFVLTLGGKTYDLPVGMEQIRFLDGKNVDEKDRAIVEEKMEKVLDLFYRAAGCRVNEAIAEKGVYGFEYARLNMLALTQMARVMDEIKHIVK